MAVPRTQLRLVLAADETFALRSVRSRLLLQLLLIAVLQLGTLALFGLHWRRVYRLFLDMERRAAQQETMAALGTAAGLIAHEVKNSLNGLKETVIIGKLIPAATGLKRYRRIEIEPAEPLTRGMDDVGLLEQDLAELGIEDGDGLGGFGAGLDDLEQLERMGNGGNGGQSAGLAEELAELDVPEGDDGQ